MNGTPILRAMLLSTALVLLAALGGPALSPPAPTALAADPGQTPGLSTLLTPQPDPSPDPVFREAGLGPQASAVRGPQSAVVPAVGGPPSAVANAVSSNVELVGHIGGATYAVAVRGDYAYIGVGQEFTVLDVSNPAAPRKVGGVLLREVVQDIDVLWPYAYVATRWDGLWVVDVSNPTAPREVGFYDDLRHSWDIYVAGGYAYVADWDLRVVDVSNPRALQEVGFYDTPGYAEDVFVAGDYAYVADGDAGLRVVDVSNPVSPREVGLYDTPGGATGVYATGGYAYVADEPWWDGSQWMEGGLRVLEVTNPASPREVGFYNTPGAGLGRLRGRRLRLRGGWG